MKSVRFTPIEVVSLALLPLVVIYQPDGLLMTIHNWHMTYFPHVSSKYNILLRETHGMVENGNRY